MLSKFKSQTLYVQIKENQFIIKSVQDNETITLDASTPFSTNRLLVGEFTIAEELLTIGFEKILNTFLNPIVIMHPIDKIDEKLSEVEEKCLKELALNAGAREVRLWIGDELTDEELLEPIKEPIL